MEFKPWPKIIRIEQKRTPIFTEKIDGTNACIVIGENGEKVFEYKFQDDEETHIAPLNKIVIPEEGIV